MYSSVPTVDGALPGTDGQSGEETRYDKIGYEIATTEATKVDKSVTSLQTRLDQ